MKNKNIPKGWWDDPKLKAEFQRRKIAKMLKLKQFMRDKFETKYLSKKKSQ